MTREHAHVKRLSDGQAVLVCMADRTQRTNKEGTRCRFQNSSSSRRG
jgi:hypothetical protein